MILRSLYSLADLVGSQNINGNCFGKCVPKPGSTLSAGEETCMTQCMEKYMAAWNTIGKEYTNRLQREQSNGWMLGGS